jgi:sugar/nucleoside kinase (ribokinase family)
MTCQLSFAVFPGYPVMAVDITGAGDRYCAAFQASYRWG